MKPELKRLILSAVIPLIFIFAFYLIKIYELSVDTSFAHMGIYPLEKKGVLGIFAHPFIHGSLKHLAANTLPFFVLSWCLYYFYRDTASAILFLIWTGSGLLTFLIGKAGWHIGASGVIYGMAFFLFFSGMIKRTRALIAISLLITFLYGSIVWGMFPQFVEPDVSWEGHLSGAICGIIAAILFRHKGPEPERPPHEDDNEEENDMLYEKWTKSLEPPQPQHAGEDQTGSTTPEEKH